MNDILRTYMERFRENRHTLRRYTAFVLALAMITTLFVNWQLHGVGISMTAQYQCGEEEHTHTADCYTKVLTCGYNEGDLENAAEVAAAEASQPSAEDEIMPLALEPQIEFVPHEHTEDCYTEVQTLTCMEEEHVHGDDCFDPEDGSLICDKFEHTHDESCYTTEYELTCGLEEGELVEQVVEPTQSAELAAMAVAEPVALAPMVDTVEPIYHHHTDACYEEVLTCPLPEHHHTVACLSDTSADLETPEEWQAANAEAVMTGNWAEDLVSVAQTQLGYEQSEKNFEIDPADGVTLRYYSRYGQSYGNPYGEWDVMFLSYCLKYAGIPQSAIPQEASVLALRSSMSDMEWLLDGEDGSAADVGDIVIYNKYVTRTVAVDSSADSAEPDLDDLFSVDTEFENSAELEDSGVSALDAAPSADDSTGAQDTAATSGTQDTVLTPEPVDPQPEQPAEKPVDSADTAAPSTVTSVSGADALAPSVVSPAAEPQTTTVTDALPVETVGIVSSVDEDADTLTVISGDVDGKVAEVTLFNTEVENVISVAYAQIELSEGDTSSDIIEIDPVFSCSVTTVYGTVSASAVRPSRSRAARYAAPSTYAAAAVSATAVDMGTHITNVSVQVPAYTDGSGNVTSWKDANGIVRPGQTVKVQLNYGFLANEITSDNRVATYKLPNGITLLPSVSHSGNITWHDSTTGKNVIVGTYAIDGDTVTFTYNEEFADGKAFDGDFEFKASVSSDSSMENQEINFGGTTGSVTIKKEDLTHDLSLSKNVQKDEAGKELIKFDSATKTLDIAYEVVAKTTNGTGTTVDITDFFDTVNSSLPRAATYQQSTIKLIKVDADGNKTDVTTDYQGKLNVGTELKYDALPKLEAGEQYILQYHATIPVHDDYTYQSINNVKAEFDGKDGTVSKEVKNTEPRLTKSGNYDASSRIITWTVKINNPYGEDLRGKTFTDLLPTGLEVVNNVKIQRGYYSNDLGPISAEDFKNAGYSYTFPNDLPHGPETATFYTIEIQTKVPDGTAVGTTYKNEATFDGNSASGDVTVTDRDSYLSKSLYKAEDLETGKKKLTWQTSVSIPTGWNEITLTDTIHDAEVSGAEQEGTHYAVLSELKAEINANLHLTLFNSSETVTMANASEHHVTFTVTYYDEYGNQTTNNDAHVTKFTITAKLADGQTLDATSMVLSSYHTVADISNAGIEEPWRFVNTAASGDKTSDASYTYKKPKEAKLEKLVYNENNFDAAGSKISELDYKKNNGKIYYELTIPTSLTCKDLLTTKDLEITDTLPAGVTFDISNVITVGALSLNDDGSVPHQSWLAQTIHGSDGRPDYKISTSENFDVSKNSIGATDTDRTITFTIKSGYNVSAKPQVFYIRYWVSVAEDASWDDLRTENKYRNSAEWNGDKAETETTVKRSYEKLYKTGTIVDEGTDDTGNKLATKKINYSVVINPTGAKLLTTSNTLTLTDTLSFNPSANTSAELDLSSIHLYGVTLDTTTGNIVADHTNEIGHDRFTATYDSPSHTMTVTVPDELACVLEYTYQISYPSSTEVTVKNHANLSGLEEKWVDTHVVNYDSSATVRFSKFDLNKVDSNDYLVTLPGATFQLAKWDTTTNAFKEVCTLETDNSGQIHFSLATAESHDTSSAQLLCSTLYRIVETKQPDGYALSKSPIYLLWGASSNTKRADAFNAATGESFIHDASEYDKRLNCNDVTYLARGESSAVYMPNTANSITVAKHWLDTDGKTELALDKVNSTYTATVELRRKSYQYGSQKSDDWVKTVTLDNSNNWSYSWNDLPLTDPADSSITYKYYVEETACSGTFKYDLNNTGITGGTILLYNQVPEDANYELPSTGGSGTLPYTAVGGTMMLSALAYSFIHRKRRREGRADD